MIRPDKNDEIKGYYKINDNKLIITLGSDGYDSFIWITNLKQSLHLLKKHRK